MKNWFYLFLPLSGLMLTSCGNNLKHPQANVAGGSPPETEASILHYADSIDAIRNDLEKKASLVYQVGDHTLYVEKLSANGEALQYAEHSIDEGLHEQTTRYYLRKDSLLLVSTGVRRNKGQAPVFEEKRSYLRKNIPFSQEHRIAGSFSSLQTKPFVQVNDTLKTENYEGKIAFLDEALMQQNKFNMIFDQFLNTSEGKFIMLKSKIPGGYSSAILVKDEDTLTDSLEKHPDYFKDARLNLKWEIREKQAVYVPVAASMTSASGLKR